MNKIDREKKFHNKIFEDNSRKKVSKLYSITKYSRKRYLEILNSSEKNSHILEYGCGLGSYAYDLAKNKFSVTGIDISDYAINIAQKKAKQLDLKINFEIGDAENLRFDDRSFDLVCGTGILHHLDLKKSFSELERVLKNKGKAVFIEPLGHNPLINTFRKLTPNLRSVDEHPLLLKDINLMKQYFDNVEIKHFHFLDIICFVFRKKKYFEKLLKIVNKLEQFIFKVFPFTKRYAWQVVIIAKKA